MSRTLGSPVLPGRPARRSTAPALLAAVLGLVATALVLPLTPARAATTVVNLLPPPTAGQAPADADTRAVELGTRFSPTVDGDVVGVRVWKASARLDATPRTGTLWSSTGQQLARASFSQTSTTGWVRVSFSSPVAVRAGQTYTVSAFAPAGRYAATTGYFASAHSTDYLSAPSGTNGVYRYGSTSGYPTSSYRSTSYWVDVRFAPGTTSPGPTPSPTPAPSGGFPTAATAGLPAGWTPTRTVTGDYSVTTPGAVVSDLKVTNGNLLVKAPNVTLRRVQVLGGAINNSAGGGSCNNGLVIEDSTVGRAPGQVTSGDNPVVFPGGYTARNVKIDGLPEGFRVGGHASGCGPVDLESSYARIVQPDVCSNWHGDGVQGYDGSAVRVRNTTLRLIADGSCGGTAPFFYPANQGNTSVDIDGLLVQGSGYPFREGMPGTVRNLDIVDKSWAFGPITVKCSVVTAWSAQIVTLDANGQPVPVRSQPCNTESLG